MIKTNILFDNLSTIGEFMGILSKHIITICIKLGTARINAVYNWISKKYSTVQDSILLKALSFRNEIQKLLLDRRRSAETLLSTKLAEDIKEVSF